MEKIIGENIRSLIESFCKAIPMIPATIRSFRIQLSLKGAQIWKLGNGNIFKKKETRSPMKHTPFDNYEAKNG